MVAQGLSSFSQVQEGDQRVSLAAAIGYLQTQHRFSALTCQPVEHLAGHFLHAEGGIGAVEEHARISVDQRCVAGAHIVHVGGEFSQLQLALADIFSDFTNLVPGLNAHEGSSNISVWKSTCGSDLPLPQATTASSKARSRDLVGAISSTAWATAQKRSFCPMPLELA